MKSGIFVGLNKGFIVQKPTVTKQKVRPAYRKGRLGILFLIVRKAH